MTIKIERTPDKVKLKNEDLRQIIIKYVEAQTGRSVQSVEFHAGRSELGAATVTLHFEDNGIAQ